MVIEQMEHFSHRLGDLSSRVESTHENTAQGLEQGARQRDEQLRGMMPPLSFMRKKTRIFIIQQFLFIFPSVSENVTMLCESQLVYSFSDAGPSGPAAEGHGRGENKAQRSNRQDGHPAG